TMLWRLEGQPKAEATLAFTDVEQGVWYTDAVNWAASKGIVKGYSDTVFAPNDTVTREQLATILCRYAEYKEYDVSAKGDLTAFADGGKTSPWAVDAMTWAVGSKLLSGKGGGVLDPTGTATRAEVAQIFMNFAQNLKK
ncbi:MAG: S-layer homology domain-containing protein, partial [Clostridiales bacterium]|nr:S-layer homology domain-containing protein [Clostridiales bacterium]